MQPKRKIIKKKKKTYEKCWKTANSDLGIWTFTRNLLKWQCNTSCVFSYSLTEAGSWKTTISKGSSVALIKVLMIFGNHSLKQLFHSLWSSLIIPQVISEKETGQCTWTVLIVLGPFIECKINSYNETSLILLTIIINTQRTIV